MEKYNWNFSSLQKVDQSNTKISKKLLLAIFNTSTTKGLSPKEQPYEYIKLSGNKIAVYQLQSIDNVSIIKKSKKEKSKKEKSEDKSFNTLMSLYNNLLYSSYISEVLKSANISYGNKK